MKNFLSKFKTKYVSSKKAKIGDIMLSNGKFMPFEVYLLEKDNLKYEPIGIVGIPKGVLPDGKGRLVSIDFMDYNNPEQGSKFPVTMYWGDSVTEFPENMCTFGFWKVESNNDNNITGIINGPSYYQNYTYNGSSYESKVYPKHFGYSYGPPVSLTISSLQNSAELNQKIFLEETIIPGTSTTTQLRQSWEKDFKLAQTDFDGQGNTDRIVTATTATTITNSNSQGNFPAANCCVAYKKGNRNWYLPAIGELLVICQNLGNLIKSLNSVNGFPIGTSIPYIWSSSCVQVSSSSSLTQSAFSVYPYNGYVNRNYRNIDNSVLAVSAF